MKKMSKVNSKRMGSRITFAVIRSVHERALCHPLSLSICMDGIKKSTAFYYCSSAHKTFMIVCVFRTFFP